MSTYQIPDSSSKRILIPISTTMDRQETKDLIQSKKVSLNQKAKIKTFFYYFSKFVFKSLSTASPILNITNLYTPSTLFAIYFKEVMGNHLYSHSNQWIYQNSLIFMNKCKDLHLNGSMLLMDYP